MRRMMIRLSLVLLVACASSTQTDSQATTGGSPVAADTATAGSDDPGDGVATNVADAPIPMNYYIDGEQVDEAAFSALHSRLTIEPEAFQGETVENEDGSYGGASESFRARDAETEYIYTSAVFRAEDDTTTESRILNRVP